MIDKTISTAIAELRIEASGQRTEALTMQGQAEVKMQRSKQLYEIADKLEAEAQKSVDLGSGL